MNVGHFERLTAIYFVCNILRPYNYKAISKIKNINRASNKPYNLCFLNFLLKFLPIISLF